MRQTTTAEQAQGSSRGLDLALWLTAMVWALAAGVTAGRAAQGISLRFRLGAVEALLEQVFAVFLLVLGFRVLDWLGTRGRCAAETLPLPGRAGWGGEWGVGAAVGWGLALAAVLPVLLSGHLHARLNLEVGSLLAAVSALAALLAGALAQELIFHGYPFRRLIAVIGPSWTAVVMALGFALVLECGAPGGRYGAHPMVGFADEVLLGLLLAMAYLRTNALWVAWGLHFAYRAVTAVVLGLAIAGHGEFGSFADSTIDGPGWLTGGAWGLDAAWITPVLLVAAMSVLYTATREYAWNYTHPLILPAGYAVEVAPPPAHVAMEKAAAPATPQLVQILPVTPRGPQDRG